jgi:hypothetical protein
VIALNRITNNIMSNERMNLIMRLSLNSLIIALALRMHILIVLAPCFIESFL